jgi:hypothetical protein
MKRLTRTLYFKKEDLDLIVKDINAVNEYTVFSNEEKGSIQVDVQLSIPESFLITEDILMTIIEGFFPQLEESEHQDKFNKVIQHLRSVGASI